MWKHEVIRYLDPIGEHFSSAQEFYFADSDSLLSTVRRWSLYDENGSLFRLPYPMAMFSVGRGKHRMSVVCTEENEDIQIVCISIHNNKYEIVPLVAYYYRDKSYNIFSLGNGLGNPVTPKLNAAQKATQECLLTEARWIAGAALNLIHARNVYVAPLEPDGMEKRNRKRRKKGLPLLERYHVLKYCPGKTVSKNASGIGMGQNTGSMPVHLCRGHFMHVSPERPLFGRPGCHGAFWVQAHVRGDKRNGVVVKDYEVVCEGDGGCQ